MVDVGYCINGKHGVIRNVSLTANPYSDHRVFTSADCKEQYCMKVDNIEYIIPSDIECVSGKMVFDKDGVTEYGADGSVVMKGRYVENDEDKFDYNVVYTTDGVMMYHTVPKSKLADVIADAFENGGRKTVSIGRVERKDDNT